MPLGLILVQVEVDVAEHVPHVLGGADHAAMKAVGEEAPTTAEHPVELPGDA